MKWLLIGSIIIISASVLLFVFITPKHESATINPATGFPMANSTSVSGEPSASFGGSMQKTISFATPNGGVVTVKDFITNGETVADTVNPGSYVLAGSLGYCLPDGKCPSGLTTEKFLISFNEKSHFFNIVLLAEPLGEVRAEAEQFLTDRLGLTSQEICTLNYFVGTPYWVNETYSGKNLGFSFCPGATVLPR